jgi:glucose/arabinose dehydrogenase
MKSMKRILMGLFVTGLLVAIPQVPKAATGQMACNPDNGGITVPDGFCAAVVADGLGTARHIAVAPNGDVYVSLQSNSSTTGGGVVALRSTKGDGKLDMKVSFGAGSTTGIMLENGYLYLAHPVSIERYKMTAGELKPAGDPEVLVSDLPSEREHQDKTIVFDGKGSFYINVGSPSNACQAKDRQLHSQGQDPCPILEKHGGVWKFDENKLGQKEDDGTKYVTGLRQEPAMAWGHGSLYITMNSRDQLDTLWPGQFTAQENAERPAEPMFRAEMGDNFGWPFCFYDYGLKKFVTNPEYGGDGKSSDRCTKFDQPVASYPAHWAPVDMMFYSGKMFPAKYRGGAFIAFHGSWNRAPLPQAGYNVTFQSFSGDKPSGDFEIFAGGFAGKQAVMNPNIAIARPDGVAEGPDGSLYIADSQKGKLWRVIYKGK